MRRKILSAAVMCSMVISMVSGIRTQAAGKTVPSLSVSSKKLKVKQSFTLKVKQDQAKKIVKTAWTVFGKKVTLSKKKKMSVLVTGKTAGTAKITATVTYQNGDSQK